MCVCYLPTSLTLYDRLAFLERANVRHLVVFDLEPGHTAPVALILLATDKVNLQQRQWN